MSEAILHVELERFGRLYATSSHVSRAVVRNGSREELLQEVVRVLVEVGKFAMALIAWHDPASHELVPMARCGDADRYADCIRVFTDGRPEGQGPGGTAFREGVPYVSNDFLNDPLTVPWREAARAAGWRASAAFPISLGGSPCALLSVYSPELDAFGPDQVDLLQRIAVDVAFGLEHLAVEQQRRVAEAALAASEQRLSFAMEAGTLGTFEWDLQTGKIFWNGHREGMFGFEQGGFDGTYAGFEKYVHPDDLPKVNRALPRAIAGRNEYSRPARRGLPTQIRQGREFETSAAPYG